MSYKIYIIFPDSIEGIDSNMEKIVRLDVENGYYLFKFGQILYDRKLSINKLIRDTNTDFKVLKRLISGDLVRIDIFVIARLCDYLNCKIKDLIEYFPNVNSNTNNITL